MSTDRNPTTDAAAQIIATLIAAMDQWGRENLNSVPLAVAWLKANARDDLWLPDSVRRMMEAS